MYPASQNMIAQRSDIALRLHRENNTTKRAITIAQHKRNGRFTEKLVAHGFTRDTSITAATNQLLRKSTKNKARFESMNALIEDYYESVSDLIQVQHDLNKQQQGMAIQVIKNLSIRIIQHASRLWMARRKLYLLKTARFISDRVYFQWYYRRRMRAAGRLGVRVLIFLARKCLKVLLKQKCAVIRIQKLYHKWILYKNMRYRTIILGKACKLMKHCLLFGKCRAIMYMRRVEVKRIQAQEQKLYRHLVAEERLRAQEASRREQEDRERAALERQQGILRRAQLALKKQQQQQQLIVSSASNATNSSTATSKMENNRRKINTDNSSSSSSTSTAAAKQTNRNMTKSIKKTTTSTATAASPLLQTSDTSDAVSVGADIAPVEMVGTERQSIANRPLDTSALYQAFSAGIFAGQDSTRAMHAYSERRYGSVYGGFYGEYCCIQDNYMHSFAAVRFRFMLRCLRQKRLKALNGSTAKTFFYMLSHLHNTSSARRCNVVISFLQQTVQQQTGASSVQDRDLSQRFLQSCSRSKAAQLGGDCSDAALVPSTARTERDAPDQQSESEEASSTFLTTIASAPPSVRFIPSPARPVPIAHGDSPFPTFRAENLPPCFVTGSYRPRTFAELVLMLSDMRHAVLRSPSLVDDATPPSSVRSGKTVSGGLRGAAISALLRGHGSSKRKLIATSSAFGNEGTSAKTPVPVSRHTPSPQNEVVVVQESAALADFADVLAVKATDLSSLGRAEAATVQTADLSAAVPALQASSVVDAALSADTTTGLVAQTPVQLRAPHRVLRPAAVLDIKAPSPVPPAYPHSDTISTTQRQSEANTGAHAYNYHSSPPERIELKGVEREQLLGENLFKEQVSTGRSGLRSRPAEGDVPGSTERSGPTERYVSPAVQALQPSAIIAAARASVRQAESTHTAHAAASSARGVNVRGRGESSHKY